MEIYVVCYLTTAPFYFFLSRYHLFHSFGVVWYQYETKCNDRINVVLRKSSTKLLDTDNLHWSFFLGLHHRLPISIHDYFIATLLLITWLLRRLERLRLNNTHNILEKFISWRSFSLLYFFSQPSIRGILTSCAGVAVMLGFFVVFLLGTVTTWRITAAICVSVPLATMIAICFVPETPMWLLSKNRKEDAQKSLQWLRGWVSPTAVEKEFQEMQRYNKNAAQCTPCQKSQNSKCDHPPPSEWMKLKELMRKRNLRPFALVMLLFAFGQLSGLTGMRPYLVQIFQAYGVPLDANWATVSTALLGLAANIVCMVSIKFVGKRRLALFSFTLTSLSCLSLAVYAFNVFPPGWSSSDAHDSVNTANGLNYLAMFLFFTLAFATSVGVLPVPWILLSEVFPFK